MTAFSNLNSSTDTYVRSFTYLEGRRNEERALPFLQRVASLVKPIMRKRGWILPTLSEFFPSDNNLVGLNVNAGEKILLRLRPYHSPDSFYDEEQVILVMLHELTHNVHGPHDDKFYKFLAELEEEYYELKRTGYSGEGFFSAGNVVGGRRPISVNAAKEAALRAAERRRGVNRVLNGPNKLGNTPSGSTRSTKTLRQLAAEAAERRARDQKSCAISQERAEMEALKATQDSVIIDLTGDGTFSMDDFDFTQDDDDEVMIVDDSHALPLNTNAKGKQPLRGPAQATPISSQRPPRSSKSKAAPQSSKKPEWSCHVCTLLNESASVSCAACYTTRPQSLRTEGWDCLACGTRGNSHDFWSCSICGVIKTSS